MVNDQMPQSLIENRVTPEIDGMYLICSSMDMSAENVIGEVMVNIDSIMTIAPFYVNGKRTDRGEQTFNLRGSTIFQDGVQVMVPYSTDQLRRLICNHHE